MKSIAFVILFLSVIGFAAPYELPSNYNEKLDRTRNADTEARFFFGKFHGKHGECVISFQKKDGKWLVGLGDGHGTEVRRDEPRVFVFKETYKGDDIYVDEVKQTYSDGNKYSSFVRIRNGKFIAYHWAYDQNGEAPGVKWTGRSKHCRVLEKPKLDKVSKSLKGLMKFKIPTSI